jgi:hypothetical protein
LAGAASVLSFLICLFTFWVISTVVYSQAVFWLLVISYAGGNGFGTYLGMKIRIGSKV